MPLSLLLSPFSNLAFLILASTIRQKECRRPPHAAVECQGGHGRVAFRRTLLYRSNTIIQPVQLCWCWTGRTSAPPLSWYSIRQRRRRHSLAKDIVFACLPVNTHSYARRPIGCLLEMGGAGVGVEFKAAYTCSRNRNAVPRNEILGKVSWCDLVSLGLGSPCRRYWHRVSCTETHVPGRWFARPTLLVLCTPLP